MANLDDLSREQLLGMLDDFAKNWLAHDGLWFQAIEARYGMDRAMECDSEAWKKFSVLEARRIMKRHHIAENSGLEGLKKALEYRLYARLNKQLIVEETLETFLFVMQECRVQSARKRRGLDEFPCKGVGLIEYTQFANTIDPRIVTSCVNCPPDPALDSYACAWRFSLHNNNPAT